MVTERESNTIAEEYRGYSTSKLYERERLLMQLQLSDVSENIAAELEAVRNELGTRGWIAELDAVQRVADKRE